MYITTGKTAACEGGHGPDKRMKKEEGEYTSDRNGCGEQEDNTKTKAIMLTTTIRDAAYTLKKR
jgi:hypothetical protein